MTRKNIHPNYQSGFTLIELLSALTLFALLITLGYRSLSTLSLNHRSIERHTDSQQSKSLAHLALRNALQSGAVIVGNSHQLELKLENTDTLAFPNSRSVYFLIKQGSLSSRTDLEASATTLIDDIDSAAFTYIDSGTRHANWSLNKPPQMLELIWLKGGQTHRWLFAAQ